MKRVFETVGIYSACHFLVDFSCAYVMFRYVQSASEFYLFLLIYNFLAFAMQMPFGLLTDRINRNSIAAVAGCGCVAASFLFGGMPVPAVLLAGVGNGLFHVGGGVDILNISTKRASALGVFVSPGAFGIYFGTLLGKQNAGLSYVLVTALIVMGAAVLFVSFRQKRRWISDNVPVSFENIGHPGVIAAVVCLFAVVCLRAYVGLVLDFSWKSQGSYALCLICAVVFGKAAGGFLSDGIGAVRASVVSLGAAAVLFLFSDYPAAGILAVFLFNMTMPITLWAVARLMKESKGFSFGLLTFALFIGFLPVYLGAPLLSRAIEYSAAAIISLGLLLLGLRKQAR